MNTRYTEEEKKQILEEFNKSKLTVLKFCKKKKISYTSFAKWRSLYENNSNVNLESKESLDEVVDKHMTRHRFTRCLEILEKRVTDSNLVIDRLNFCLNTLREKNSDLTDSILDLRKNDIKRDKMFYRITLVNFLITVLTFLFIVYLS